MMHVTKQTCLLSLHPMYDLTQYLDLVWSTLAVLHTLLTRIYRPALVWLLTTTAAMSA